MSRILIVEDEQHISDGLRFNLEAEGHEALAVPDGEQALHILLEERRLFDVIVLDVMLPGKDGFTVAADLRAAEQFVPILMLTARGRPEDVLRGFESGADDYLPKPFELAILIARVNGLLRRRRWNEPPVVEEAAKGRRVRRVTLDVGQLSGVMPDAILFCFDIVAKGTLLDGARTTAFRCFSAGGGIVPEGRGPEALSMSPSTSLRSLRAPFDSGLP